MTPETQKLVDQRNQKAVKAIQELQKLPYSPEQRTNQVNQAYKAHNQVNPNKQNNQIISYTSITLTQNPGTDKEIALIGNPISCDQVRGANKPGEEPGLRKTDGDITNSDPGENGINVQGIRFRIY